VRRRRLIGSKLPGFSEASRSKIDRMGEVCAAAPPWAPDRGESHHLRQAQAVAGAQAEGSIASVVSPSLAFSFLIVSLPLRLSFELRPPFSPQAVPAVRLNFKTTS